MEETKKTSQWTAKKTMMIVVMGLLTAIVVVLQIFASGIWLNPTTCITLVLAPTIVGAALYGWKAGAWLGAVFSAVVLISVRAAVRSVALSAYAGALIARSATLMVASFWNGIIICFLPVRSFPYSIDAKL